MILKRLNNAAPYLLISLVAIGLRYLIPTNPIFFSPHDDLLMVELAKNMMEGKWLGEWLSDTTVPGLSMVKPPGYSLFLIFAYYLHLPPPIVLLLIYLLTNYLFVNYLIRCKDIEKIIVFAVLSFNPVIYAAQFSRLYRDSLIMILFWLSIVSTLFILKLIYENHQDNSIKIYLLIIFNSVILGYMKIIKNDTYIFLVLFFSCVFIYNFIYLYKKINDRLQLLRFFTISLALLIIFLNLVPQLIELKNKSYYGVQLVEDNNSGALAEAWKQMARIKVKDDEWNSYPISPKMFQKIDEEIPSFEILSPYMLGETGWKNSNCELAGRCTGSSGPFVLFELRDAAILGGVSNPVEFEELFSQIASEIKQFCSINEDSCYARTTIFGGPAFTLKKLNIRGTLDGFSKSLSSIYTWNSVEPNRVTNYDEVNLEIWAKQIETFQKTIRNLTYKNQNVQSTPEALYFKYTIELMKNIYSAIFTFSLLLLGAAISLRIYMRGAIRRNYFEEMWLGIIITFTIFASLLYGFIDANGWYILNGAKTYFMFFTTLIIIFTYLSFKYSMKVFKDYFQNQIELE